MAEPDAAADQAAVIDAVCDYAATFCPPLLQCDTGKFGQYIRSESSRSTLDKFLNEIHSKVLCIARSSLDTSEALYYMHQDFVPDDATHCVLLVKTRAEWKSNETVVRNLMVLPAGEVGMVHGIFGQIFGLKSLLDLFGKGSQDQERVLAAKKRITELSDLLRPFIDDDVGHTKARIPQTFLTWWETAGKSMAQDDVVAYIQGCDQSMKDEIVQFVKLWKNDCRQTNEYWVEFTEKKLSRSAFRRSEIYARATHSYSELHCAVFTSYCRR
eukprot:Rmarinus@m.8512